MSLRVLVLGGTGFNGPHFVAALRERGHTITLFNLDCPRPVPADVEVLIGDRNGEMAALRNRDWDVVIDNCAYAPRHVKLSVEALSGHIGQYILLSSNCAYRDHTTPGTNEDYPLATLQDPTLEEVNRQTYGGLKVLCEQVVEQAYGARATILRPTYIVGPGDATDRFTYWPVRVSRGGKMLVPGTPSDPIQFIDVRDVADFIRVCAEQRIGGRYNVCIPAGSVTMGDLLETSKRLSGSNVTFVWAGAALDSLPENHQIGGDLDLTIWAPRSPKFEGWPLLSSARAVAKGLRFRSLEVTVRDTLTWHNQRPLALRQKLKAGMTPEREAELMCQFVGQVETSHFL